ncbi:LLM class flavin-dependent oxidoreductase (plasmid) [Paraburkholderia sp. D15]|uniref:LLM class flavin-dependent oxidoreductase n=1 Tax=Paraburkholderia sp. D15 TaxID=2880218 RepID=UPI00247A8013|nr:LLM class flavin-dependent oxidoreductase [Paraburkholderia sp. D15]WGS55267.1 LLM class flavin-dependent oxidoreductase [Paraburkholderia sp. D15]
MRKKEFNETVLLERQMIKIFTTGNPFAPGIPDLSALKRQGAEWDASEAIDEVLIGYSALWPQNFATSTALASVTNKLKLIVAHRPGVMHPTAAARTFGTMDFLSGGGRLAINLVSGSSDKDLHREGDYLAKVERYDRATEYVECMKRCWSEPKSFDHQGKYYQAEAVRQLMRPMSGHIPIYMGGESDEAVEFGARHADVYMLWGEPLSGTRERIERVKASAARHGREPQFSLSLRIFLGATDEAAWEKARAVERTILDAEGTNRFLRSAVTDKSVGRDRQLSFANEAVHDDCFWAGLVKLLGGFANSAGLVGTPDRVMAALRRYRELGVDAFLITTGLDGFWDPSLEDFVVQMKKEL